MFKKNGGYLLVFIAGSLWGTQGIFLKFMNAQGSSPMYTSFLRMFFSFALLFAIALVRGGLKSFKVSLKTLISCILLGVVCQALYNLSYSNAVNMMGMALASVLLYTAPMFTSVFSRILFKEGFTRVKTVALVLNIIGCILVVTGGHFGALSFRLVGLLFGLGSGLAYSFAPIFGRLATDSEDSNPYAIATYNFLFATIFLGFFRPWTTVARPANPKLLLAAFLLAGISTAFAYVIYYTGLKNITETSKVPVVASVETVMATAIGVFLFHEVFGLGNLIGIILVLASIAIVNLFAKRADKSEAEEVSTEAQAG